MGRISYIENDPQFGIDYDYKLIKKEFKKLGVPSNVWTPLNIPTNVFWSVIMSERRLGKTTNLLLYGMCMNKLYGTVIQYMRSREDMIMPKYSSELFKTILAFDYVEKLTDGKYNTIIRKSRAYYYAKKLESGEIEYEAPDPFLMMLSIDNSFNAKSSYNAPFGDIIIFDEFIGKYYPLDEFPQLCDYIDTIRRKRRCVRVFMLSNTIDRESEYFNELEIYDLVQEMKKGEHEVSETEKGTKVYVEIAENEIITQEKIFDKINFFGFRNPKIAAITGDDWATYNYQHIPDNKFKTLSHRFHILNNGRYYELELVDVDDIGLAVYVHRSSRLYDDSVVYTIGDIQDARYRYGTGYTKSDLLIWKKLYNRNRFFYANNMCGAAVANYINSVSYL